MTQDVGVLVMEHICRAASSSPTRSLARSRLSGEIAVAWIRCNPCPPKASSNGIRKQIEKVTNGAKVEAIGIGFPGIIRNGVVEDSPNLHQIKGCGLQAALSSALTGKLAGNPGPRFQ